MQRTRRAILDILKQRQRATLEELTHEVGLASMTVRGHLSVLERDGLIAFEEERGKVGRPRFVYSLTERGQEEFPKNYHVLCNRVLDVLGSLSSPPTPGGIVERLADRWAQDYEGRVAGKSLDEKVQIIAAIRSEEGAMACCEKADDGYLLHQRHCPASCVAARHPDVICAAEMAFIKRLLGASVERVKWVQRGDTTCSYRIRPLRAISPESSPRILSEFRSSNDLPCRPAPAD